MREALDKVTKAHIVKVIRLTHEAVSRLRSRSRIAVAGLNPHAGEHGAFGSEEISEISPAVEIAKAEGLDVSGPLPPDTVFYQAVNGKYEAVVCMYHDQGHIPLKLLAFEDAVNVTLGLPIIRTSVDHGTAYDIAYQGKASIRSFCNALELAERMIDLK
jgi:4-hydroxythreonine-4-phosphate dehydrogenase